MSVPKVILVLGYSGAGISTVLEAFSKLHYLTLENLQTNSVASVIYALLDNHSKIAISLKDCSHENMLIDLASSLDSLNINFELIFLEADEKILVKRFSETRRKHPRQNLGLLDAITADIKELSYIKPNADRVIDTTNFTREDLINYIKSLYGNKDDNKLLVNIISFGYKYGIPIDADYVFDMRFISNPFYIEELRPYTGNDENVYNYVMAQKETQTFVDMWLPLVEFLLTSYINVNRPNVTIAVGCTGGKHRSVSLARYLHANLTNQFNTMNLILTHRDIETNKKETGSDVMIKDYLANRLPRSITWLLPGLKLKRWLSLVLLGSSLLGLGTLISFKLMPIHYSITFIQMIARLIPAYISGPLCVVAGISLIAIGLKNTNKSIFDAVMPEQNGQLLEAMYRRRKLNKGPRVIAIGGGTGLPNTLRGMKAYTNNITAVVTVGDDGGSSGRLREEMGIIPPGDIRNCIAALSDEEQLVTSLFQYRFEKGEGIEGHSFGNLFLSALCDITGSMETAIKESSKVLSIRGNVLPASLQDMTLAAKLEDNTIVKGESNIPYSGKKISKVFSIPDNLDPSPEVMSSIAEADLIILGPGSLYTSVIPNLLIKGIPEQIAANKKAKKIYVCNIMTQPGETNGYSMYDHVKAILDHAGGHKILDAVLVNDVLSRELEEKYKLNNSFKVKIDAARVESLGVQVLVKKLIDETNQDVVRHSYRRVARSIMHWFRTSDHDTFQTIVQEKTFAKSLSVKV